MSELHIDVESRSVVDLRKTGLFPYWEHEHTDLWGVCFSVDDDPVQRWLPGDPCPEAIRAAVDGGWLVFGHNVNFEYASWFYRLAPKYGWPLPAKENLRCTAAMAAAMALPRDLGGAAAAMGLDENKDQAGRRLMLQMAKPRRMESGQPVWWDTPDRLERLMAYCEQDVRTERALTKRLRPLSDTEQALFLLDMDINWRGVRVDMESVKKADRIVKTSLDTLDAELSRRTSHRVEKASQAARLTEWLREQGVDVESVDKQAVKDALATEGLADNVRRVLEIRREAAKSSTAKLEAMKLRTCADGRTRETLLYCGASTGRWSGKGIQLQNLPRPSLKPRDIDAVFEALPCGDPRWLEIWGSPLSVVSDCLRGMIVAKPGHELVRADLAGIEGRVLAWLAGEQWKLDAYAAYDAGAGPDLYKVAAAGMLGVDVAAIDDKQRQIGKVSELALGYQGGHGAFISMAKNYAVTPADITPAVKAAFSTEQWEAAAERFEEKNRFGLPLDEWTALRVVVDAWRGAHPQVVAFWEALDNAAMAAVREPGRRFTAGRIAYACAGNILWCQLPSGRLLAYVDPRIRDVETPWGKTRSAVTYMGVNSVTRRWERNKAYGGLWAENVTQAVARDILAEAMLRIEQRGWPLVLTVHDEAVSEVPAGSVTAQEYAAELARGSTWSAGLPLAAEGAVGRRYGK